MGNPRNPYLGPKYITFLLDTLRGSTRSRDELSMKFVKPEGDGPDY